MERLAGVNTELGGQLQQHGEVKGSMLPEKRKMEDGDRDDALEGVQKEVKKMKCSNYC